MRRFARPAAVCALALIAAPALTAASASTPILPGYWETTNRVLFPITSRKVERRCISAAQVGKFMEGPRNHIYSNCDYPVREIGQGLIRLRGQCSDKNGVTFKISGAGAYTPTTLKMTAETHVAGIPVRASLDARRLGDVCPADAKRD